MPRSAARAARLAALALALCLPPAAARAATTGWRTIELPSYATEARLAYLADPGSNGLIGYVVDLGGLQPNGTAFTLTHKAGTGLGVVQFDASFYSDLSGTGEICGDTLDTHRDGTGGLYGTISGCSSPARYAVVTLYAGPQADLSVSAAAHADFKLTWD